jgi:hypothetical protein
MVHVVRRTRKTICLTAFVALILLAAGSTAPAQRTDGASAPPAMTPTESVSGVLLPKRTRLIINYRRIRIA